MRIDSNKSVYPVTRDTFPGLRGLTKLEHYAVLVMQGMLTSDLWVENANGDPDCELALAEQAIRCAKALIAELEKEQ